jgi:serine/threonine protein kinase
MQPARILGRYALFGELASGGMATVHFGRQLGAVGFARTVAVKRLHPHLASDSEFVAMFLDEAHLAERIRHPNVVPTIDVLAQDGELWLVMDYVHGESLSRALRASPAKGGLPVDIAVSIALGVLAGLHAAHEARDESGRPLGIVHRDVSPQNVLIGADGIARVLDFGIAKATGRLHQTEQGQLKGKYAYMSPEQLQQDELDRRSDVFCVASILWEMLAGRRLYSADSPAAIAYSMVMEETPSLRSLRAEVPVELDHALLRGLARSRDDRFASADEMAQALEDAVRPASARRVQEWLRSAVGPVLRERAEVVRTIESWVVPEERPASRAELESILMSTAPTPAISRTPPLVRAALGYPAAAGYREEFESSPSGLRSFGPVESPSNLLPPELSTQLTSTGRAEPPTQRMPPRRSPLAFVLGVVAVAASAVGAYFLLRSEISTADSVAARSPTDRSEPSDSGEETRPDASAGVAEGEAKASRGEASHGAEVPSASAASRVSSAPSASPGASSAVVAPTTSAPSASSSAPAVPVRSPALPAGAPTSTSTSNNGPKSARDAGSSSATATTSPAARAPSCENPFTIDASGRKRPRPECF